MSIIGHCLVGDNIQDISRRAGAALPGRFAETLESCPPNFSIVLWEDNWKIFPGKNSDLGAGSCWKNISGANVFEALASKLNSSVLALAIAPLATAAALATTTDRWPRTEAASPGTSVQQRKLPNVLPRFALGNSTGAVAGGAPSIACGSATHRRRRQKLSAPCIRGVAAAVVRERSAKRLFSPAGLEHAENAARSFTLSTANPAEAGFVHIVHCTYSGAGEENLQFCAQNAIFHGRRRPYFFTRRRSGSVVNCQLVWKDPELLVRGGPSGFGFCYRLWTSFWGAESGSSFEGGFL